MFKLGIQWFDNIGTIHLGRGDANSQLLPQGDVGQVVPVHARILLDIVPTGLVVATTYQNSP